MPSKLAWVTGMLLLLFMKSMSPIKLSILILLISLISALAIHKTLMISLMAFITIIVFSSGMMILFIYVSSLTPTTTTKTKKYMVYFPLLALTCCNPQLSPPNQITSTKLFTSQYMLTIMTMILLVTLITISLHAHHPLQTISSTF